MKKMWKKAIAMLLVVIMIGGAAPLGALADMDWLTVHANAEDNPDLLDADEENITWNYDAETGLLTIGGTGYMDYYGYSSKPWSRYASSIRTVIICSGVTSIDNDAFASCHNLTNITIPDGVIFIGNKAFSGCGNLTSITIPDSVTDIGWQTFFGCRSLMYVEIGSGVTSMSIEPSMGNSAFFGCSSLVAFSVDDDNPAYCSDENGVLYNKDKTRLIKYPASSTRTDFTIPDSVTYICREAFYDCANLVEITVPNGITSINNETFYGCTSLEAINIPESVTSIGDAAFENCANLASVTIPDSVASIGNDAFAGCTSVLSFTVGENNANYSSDNDSVLYNKEKTIMLKYPAGNPRKSFRIPNSVTEIDSYAFEGCSSLESVTIPDGVKRINQGTFEGCVNLVNITIPNSMTNIYSSAFSGCTSLTNFSIPESLTSISNGSFTGCTSLSSFIVDTDNTAYCSGEDGVLYNKSKTTLVQYPIGNPRTSFMVPNSVTNVGDYAFCGCTNLLSVDIPDSVTNISRGAFTGCANLSSVIIPDSVTNVDGFAFYGCAGLIQIAIGSGVMGVGICAFDGCVNLSSATINSNSALSAFSGNKNLATVIIGNSVTGIGSNAFKGCTSLTSVTIPDSVTSIEYCAFSGCTALTNITIPKNVIHISEGYSIISFELGGAFSGCTSLEAFTVDAGNTSYCSGDDGVLYNKSKTALVQYPIGNTRTSFTIPDSITRICDSAFQGCTNLTNITIPDSVTEIGYYAFYGCTNLLSVAIPDSVTSIDGSAFGGVESILYTGSASGSPWGATHHYQQIITQPTCTEGGFTTYTCSVCGDSYLTDETPALGHDYDSVMIPPTCTENGFTTYTCSVCGDSYTTDEMPAPGHDYGSVVTPPTCTEIGFTTYTCSVCGDSYTTDETPALGHVFGDWTIVKTPSSSSEGLEMHVCTRCAFEETRPIDVLPPDVPAVTAADAVVGHSAGRLVIVTVDMYNNPGIIATRLYIGYDTQQLKLVQVSNGEVFNNSVATFGNDLTAEPYILLWSDDTAQIDNTLNGTLVTLTFEVQDTACAGDSEITVAIDEDSTFNASLQLTHLYAVSGTVHIVDCTPGDASGDGKISLLDSVMISRYLAGGWDVTINEINADVNGDGYVDLKDVVLIRRFLAGWNVELK